MQVFRFTGKAKRLPRELSILEKCRKFDLKELVRLDKLKEGNRV